ncbi:MAG: lipoprotein insertase outer membrane protein LolB [Brachymonas sp.]
MNKLRAAASQRRSLLLTGLSAPFLIASCAINTPANSGFSSKNAAPAPAEPLRYSGRISLVLDNAAPGSASSFSGAFNLRGLPQEGEMQLLSPLGQVVASFFWQPGLAVFVQGQQIRPFNSVNELLAQSLGASITAEQLFAWLSGQTATATDAHWHVDLSHHAEGRITARRAAPQAATLRIVLDQP